MNTQEQDTSLLEPYRVLDLTDELGFLCGRILGDLGADVVKVEPPGGAACRRIGPYYDDTPDPEKSLYWFAGNANKRGITLNLESGAGQEIFKRLVRQTDFVIESFPPGYLAGLGLDYAALAAVNPAVIMVSITPFGQTGPYANYLSTDLTTMAMGGMLNLTGSPDRAPVRLGGHQAYVNAGSEAALGALLAHHHREATGQGQAVDVSIQQSVVRTILNSLNYWDILKKNVRRQAPYRVIGGTARQRLVWPCGDGYVSFSLWGGAIGAPGNRALVLWMDDEGMAPDFLMVVDWPNFDMAAVNSAELERFSVPIGEFFLSHTAAELFQGAVKRRIMLYPVQTIAEVAADAQLEARDFWNQVAHPELGGEITYPGAFAKLSRHPMRIRRRAPLVGEHNREFYAATGISGQELQALERAGTV